MNEKMYEELLGILDECNNLQSQAIKIRTLASKLFADSKDNGSPFEGLFHDISRRAKSVDDCVYGFRNKLKDRRALLGRMNDKGEWSLRISLKTELAKNLYTHGSSARM